MKKVICSRCDGPLMFRQTCIIIEDWFLSEEGELLELKEQEQIDSHDYIVFCPKCDECKEYFSPENRIFIVDNCGVHIKGDR